MDVVRKKSQKQALKNTISNTVKTQTGGPLSLRMRQRRMNRRRSKGPGSKMRKGSKKRNVIISKYKQPKRSWSDFFAKFKDYGQYVTNRGNTVPWNYSKNQRFL